MKIGIAKEHSLEKRVAIVPAVAKKLVEMGFEVIVEKDAGLQSDFQDKDYINSGAKIGSIAEIFACDYIFKVNGLSKDEVSKLSSKSTVIANFGALSNKDSMEELAKSGATSYALDLMPRISRAQAMDVLSSQNNLAGYRAVLESAAHFNGVFPMLMTSAGTISPAKLFVMGVGVAGLQAIATARRLGALVTAYDVRMATKEQVESLGAKFLVVDEEAMKEAQTSGGYAKEMSADYKQKEAKAILEHIKKQNIVITTALIPGKKAPILVSKEMLDNMAQGSVVIDMAVSMGGNCELSKANEVVVYNGIKIVDGSNLAGLVSKDSSTFFAKNILNFVSTFYDKESKNFKFDENDDLVKGSLATKGGVVVHELLKK